MTQSTSFLKFSIIHLTPFLSPNLITGSLSINLRFSCLCYLKSLHLVLPELRNNLYIYMSLYKIELLKCKVDSDWIHCCVYSKNGVVLAATESRREI